MNVKPQPVQTVKKVLTTFPNAPSGHDSVTYRLDDLDLYVTYQCSDWNGKDYSDTIKFEFVIALYIESENNRGGLDLPDSSATLYGFKTDAREGFKGYQVWFADNQLITVVCQKVVIGGREY